MLRMARELVVLGHQVDIFTMKWEGDAAGEGINTHLLPGRGFLNHQRYEDFFAKAHAEIVKINFDLVVGFNRVPNLDVYFAADPCFEARARQSRSFFYRLLGRYRSFAGFEKAVFGQESHCEILLLTPNGKDDFQDCYGTADNRFHLLPPYLSAKRMALQNRTEMRQYLRGIFGLADSDKVLLMVGSGFERKGLDRAIRAIAALPQAVKSNTHLVMVGDGRAYIFNKMAADLGVATHVHISQGRTDVPQLMQGADVLVHPALHEMAGNVLLEAMASGLPVLASAVCGYGFHIVQASAGRLIPEPYQQSEFNQLLAQMLTSENLEAMRENGLSYTKNMMVDNDGSAEAQLLLNIAKRRAGQKGLV